MERWAGKVAVVTGASAGIGAAIAEALVRSGMIVVGLARRKDRITSLAEKLSGATGKLHAVQTDISKEDDILSAFRWIKDNFGGVDVLVNNAGIIGNTSMIESDRESSRRIMDVNVLGVCSCAREAVASMRERGFAGHIININSIAGHYFLAAEMKAGIYSGSKYAVTAITEGMRRDLVAAGTMIKITSISPGLVETEIFEKSNNTVDVWGNALAIAPKDIADGVLYVLGTPPNVQVSELTIRPVGEKL